MQCAHVFQLRRASNRYKCQICSMGLEGFTHAVLTETVGCYSYSCCAPQVVPKTSLPWTLPPFLQLCNQPCCVDQSRKWSGDNFLPVVFTKVRDIHNVFIPHKTQLQLVTSANYCTICVLLCQTSLLSKFACDQVCMRSSN